MRNVLQIDMVEILGRFVVLEGIDGAGTTTQLNKIAERCQKSSIPYWTTCEPTELPTGKFIRQILGGKVDVHPETLARLFVADRHEHVYAEDDGIIARLSRGELVVSDRYLFSSLAYQSVDCGYEKVRSLNAVFPLPAMVIYIDIPSEVGDRRAGERGRREIFEYQDFQDKARGLYQRAFEEYSRTGVQIHSIDGTEAPAEVFEKVWSAIQGLPIQKV